MAHRGRLREMGNGLVFERGGHVNLFHQLSKPGTKNDAGMRRVRPRLVNHIRGLFNLVVKFQHKQ